MNDLRWHSIVTDYRKNYGVRVFVDASMQLDQPMIGYQLPEL